MKDYLYRYDGTGNLDYAHARYRDINLGFISTDPHWFRYPGLSSYAYCGNNPIMRIDPDGNFDFQPETYTDQQLTDMGLTRSDLDRFTQIVNNIGNIVDDQVMTAITNTTGLTHEQIQSDITPGQGPKITITTDRNLISDLDARATQESGIMLRPEYIKYLASIDSDDIEVLMGQTVGLTMSILHEYGHWGDQLTNNGNNSGQFTSEGNYADLFGGNNIPRGRQIWNNGMSGTGHRGDDVEKYGFGFINGAMERTGPNIGRIPVRMGETQRLKVANIYKRLMK